tara:strand:+ start:180043 stop:180609 length:567 start_codon:yes stop_codon:yes gene_type:complete
MLNIPAVLFQKTRTLGFLILTLAACSPQYNWRQIQSDHAPFNIAMPAKPSTFSRQIDLHGTKVLMTMTAVEVGKNTFAVGTAELPDAIQAQRSLQDMQLALVNNIQGKVRNQNISIMPRSPEKETGAIAVTEIEAIGSNLHTINGQQRILYARFAADGNRVYQLIATGPEPLMGRDLATLFFTSFKFN